MSGPSGWQDPTYLLSLPERALRALAAGLGGLLYQVSLVLLPEWMRRSRLYQALVARLLRILVELVGGVPGVFPSESVDVRELALRKTAGNVLEVASFVAVGWSPLWLLAGAADLTGGTRTYLRALVAELRRDGLLPAEADIASVAELLRALEGTSEVMATTIDVPPLNLVEMRRSWQALQHNAGHLPDARRLASLYTQLQQVAAREQRSLLSISSLVAAGAVRAGAHLGQVYIFDYYAQALRAIGREGLPAYARRISQPYGMTALGHFSPRRLTYTQRLLERLSGGAYDAQAQITGPSQGVEPGPAERADTGPAGEDGPSGNP